MLQALKAWPKNFKIIFWAGFLLRIAATFFSSTAPDYVGYRLPIAECISSGQWLYCDCSYNHTPFYPYLSALMNLLSGGIPLLQSVLITLPLAIGDALVPIALYMFLLHFREKEFALKAAAFYALNPLSIIEVGIAHWDGFTTLFMVLSLNLLHQNKTVKSGIAAGFGVLLKQFPLAIGLISFARDKSIKNASILGITIVGMVMIGFLPFLFRCPDTFLSNLLSHPLWRGVASVGVDIGTVKSLVLNLNIPYGKTIWLTAFGMLLGIPFFKTNEKNYFYYAGLVLVTLAYFTFVTHRQLIVWAMPFLITFTLDRKSWIPFGLVFVGYTIRIIKPDWYFGLIHLGVGVWYYVGFYKALIKHAK